MAKTAETEVPSLTADPPELDTLEIEVDGQIGTLTLNRPDSLNAMSPHLIDELTVAAAWLADRAPIRALIVTGAGRAFSSGGDVNWFKRGVSDEGVDLPSEVRRGAEALHNAIVDIRRIPYAVIAAINGPAAGAGMSLALACDLRIAGRSARMTTAFAKVGLSGDYGGTWFLTQLVGTAKARELYFLSDMLDAARIETGRRVTGFRLGPSREVTAVETEAGPIETELVVNACGMWAPQVAAMVGAFAPSVPVDRAAPSTILDATPDRRDDSATADFSFHATEAASFTCSLDGGAFRPCGSGVGYAVQPGWHDFAVRATDRAGNVEASPAQWHWHTSARD